MALYKDQEMTDFAYYLTLSAMADVRTCNRDIASLHELGRYLFEQGDIDRAYSYIHYCLQQAQLYRNRIRLLDITQTLNDIHQSYQDRTDRQQQRLRSYLITISFCALVLLFSLFYIIRLLRKIDRQRVQLRESNHKLSEHVQESNYVKEEYIGYVFTMCSNYIDKLNDYRKGVNRKIKAGQLAELKQQTDTPETVQMELKEFYRMFDTIFLNVYPNFVSDFNTLPRPLKELKGFCKVRLQPGETREVTFTIDREALSYYDDDQSKWVAEPGKFEAIVAASATDIRSTVPFRLEE